MPAPAATKWFSLHTRRAGRMFLTAARGNALEVTCSRQLVLVRARNACVPGVGTLRIAHQARDFACCCSRRRHARPTRAAPTRASPRPAAGPWVAARDLRREARRAWVAPLLRAAEC